MENWGSRLKEIREKHELSQKIVGDALEKDITQISRYERGAGAAKMPKTFRLELRKIFTDKDIKYIEKGESVKNSSMVEETAPSYSKKDQVSIPYHKDVHASAGGGSDALNTSDTSPISFSRSFLNSFLGVYDVKGLSIINASGNSMEPTIRSGEMMFVYPVNGEEFKDGGIYVLMCSDNLLVKRVTFNPLTKQYTLISDNGSVDPVTLTIDEGSDCRFVGRVVGHLDRV